VEILFYFCIFIFGLAIGSFLNCVIYRLQKDEEFLVKRSYCPDCKKILNWPDLIPLLSYLYLRGKCRHCQAKISLQYPLVELTTGFLFVFVLFFLSQEMPIRQINAMAFILRIYYLVITALLIIIFVSDLKYYIIPDKIIYPATGIALLYNIWSLVIGHWSFKEFLNPIFSAIFASAFFIAIILISKGRWLGWGDVKLAFFMGLLLGFPNILIALFLAFLFGAIIGVGLIIAGRKTLKSEVPFGPFLVTGTFMALFWGQPITNWYLHLFI
jgi:leader peptidase (prepilin peptidase)/N-methyltransferase